MKRLATGDPRQRELFDALAPLRAPQAALELPQTAQDLVALIGLSATMDLVREMGGADPVFPATEDPRSALWRELEDLLGGRHTQALFARYKGTQLYIPKCHLALKKAMHRDVISAYDAGTPVAELRKRYKLSRRWVLKILKKPL